MIARRGRLPAVAAGLLFLGCWAGCTKKQPAAAPTTRKTDAVRSARATEAGAAPERRKTMNATAKPLPPHSITKTDGLPSDLREQHPLWEMVQSPAHLEPERGRRLYADGRLFGWGNHRRVAGPDGMPTRKAAEWAWRLDARVTKQTVDRVRTLIDTKFAKIPENPTGAEGSRYPLITWRAYPGGAEHVVVIPITEADAHTPKPIDDIEQAIDDGIVSEGVPLEQPR